MPYANPDRQRRAQRESKRRARAQAARERTERVLADVEAGVFRALPDPPRRAELLLLLGAHARAGSVRAIELLLREAAQGTDPTNLGELLRLAEARPGLRVLADLSRLGRAPRASHSHQSREKEYHHEVEY